MGKSTILIVEYPLKALRLRGGSQISVKNIKSMSWTINDKVHPVFRISKPSFIITSVLTVVSGETALRGRAFNVFLRLGVELYLIAARLLI